MMKGRDAGGQIFAAIVIRNQTFIANTGKVDYLQRSAAQKRQRLNHCLINSARTLAASHHEQRENVRAQSELFTRRHPIQTNELSPDWRPRNFCIGFWEKWRAFLKAEHDGANYPPCQT